MGGYGQRRRGREVSAELAIEGGEGGFSLDFAERSVSVLERRSWRGGVTFLVRPGYLCSVPPLVARKRTTTGGANAPDLLRGLYWCSVVRLRLTDRSVPGLRALPRDQPIRPTGSGTRSLRRHRSPAEKLGFQPARQPTSRLPLWPAVGVHRRCLAWSHSNRKPSRKEFFRLQDVAARSSGRGRRRDRANRHQGQHGL